MLIELVILYGISREIVNNHNILPAAGLIEKMEIFKFAFILKLMLNLFGITNELSKILQRKYFNIVLAMELLMSSKLDWPH